MKNVIRHATLLLILFLSAVARGVDIDISADPSLPVRNMIDNSSFEENYGSNNFWRNCGYYRGKGKVEITKEYAHAGESSLCFMGFSKDAEGQMISRDVMMSTDILYRLDFWVRSFRELPGGGDVKVRYALDDPGKISDSIDALIVPLVKIPERWIQFSSPPKDISAQTRILFWQPRNQGGVRRHQIVNSNIIMFPKSIFGNKPVKIKIYIFASGVGVVWYDDITLMPLKTKLKYTVKGSDVTGIKILNQRHKVMTEKSFVRDWPGEYSAEVVVPVDDLYQVEVKTKSGGIVHVSYPENRAKQ